MVYCASLENWRAERLRGFESHPLRHQLWDENQASGARAVDQLKVEPVGPRPQGWGESTFPKFERREATQTAEGSPEGVKA